MAIMHVRISGRFKSSRYAVNLPGTANGTQHYKTQLRQHTTHMKYMHEYFKVIANFQVIVVFPGAGNHFTGINQSENAYINNELKKHSKKITQTAPNRMDTRLLLLEGQTCCRITFELHELGANTVFH